MDAPPEFRLQPEFPDGPAEVLFHLGTHPGDQVQPHAPLAQGAGEAPQDVPGQLGLRARAAHGVGDGQGQEDPRAAAEWLTDWANNGLLALNAFQGYFHMPRLGTENIKRLLFAPDRSRVAMDLGAVLPERI